MSWRRWRTIWQRRRPADPPEAPGDTLALGCGAAVARGIAPKAALLDRARHAGLPVPAGFILPDGVELDEPVGLSGTFAVRSAFGAEDGDTTSLAGYFETHLDVDASEIVSAVADVRASADDRAGSFRRDVLVMEMVAARHAGVAFSEPGTYDDVVNVVDGLADSLVRGDTGGDRLDLPRLEQAPSGWQRRLQHLLSKVRGEFGDAPWDVEWADDDTTCWLVQIRPITRPTVRDETLTAANHAEILPRLPSQLMTSIVAEAGPDLFAWYRRRVPGLPAERDFLHVVAGRPMINLSLLEDMMRHLGLPTTLVAASIGGGHSVDHPIAPLRVARRSPSLVRLGIAQLAAVLRSSNNRRRAAAIGAHGSTSFTQSVDDLHRSYVTLVTGMFPLSSAIGPPLAALRRAGTLYEHAGRHHTITAELARRRQRLATADDRDEALREFLRDFGHRGVYESDIARPRYRDDPATLRSDAGTGAALSATSATGWTWKGRLTTPIWWAAMAPLRARELLRHDAMRSFATIRDCLVRLASTAVADGRLRSVDDLWLLDADEVRSLDDGWRPDREFWAVREREREELDQLDVPYVVGRFDDPADWSVGNAEDDQPGRRVLRGLPLTTGRVTGRAWVLDEPSSVPPDGPDGMPVVVVARSIDAGWISTLADAAAAVVEIGGDLSHGSILVREIGLPAVTNVAGATRMLADGDTVAVDAGAGTVRLVED